MDNPRQIGDLADELISDILSFLLGPESLVNGASCTNSSNLSQSTGDTRYSYTYGERSDLDRFRLVCKRFMRISTPKKFRRFVLRFSRDGFQRLEDLLGMQLACHVKYFTYMARPFYEGDGWPYILNEIHRVYPAVSDTIQRRVQDQHHIIAENRDLLLLRRAIASFPGLRQVKLLRLQDEADEVSLEYIRGRAPDQPAILEWAPACARAVTNLSISLLESNCDTIRFVGPQISPHATAKLLQTPTTVLSALAARLASLDITFHPGTVSTMSKLSGVFSDFLRAARNLTAIHLGFPATRPSDLSLEQVFHRVHWKRLQTLSLQGWRLDATEILTVARQHRRQLRDIRLTSIYLRAGRWRDILAFLQDEMEQLERVDLHEINYVRPLPLETYLNGSGSANGNGNGTLDSILADLPRPAPASSPPTFDADYMVQSHSLIPRGTARQSIPESTRQKLHALSVEDLGDNGAAVRRPQILLWEAWVLSSARISNRRRF